MMMMHLSLADDGVTGASLNERVLSSSPSSLSLPLPSRCLQAKAGGQEGEDKRPEIDSRKDSFSFPPIHISRQVREQKSKE